MREFLLACVLLVPTLMSAAEAVIDGPTGGVPGDVILLDAGSSKGEHFKWDVIPKLSDGRQTIVPIEGGKRAIVASVPGQYTVILAVSDELGVDLLLYTVTISGDRPPGPGPTPGPDPPKPVEPTFPDSRLGLSMAIYQASKTVPNAVRDAGRMADVFLGISSQVAAGGLKGQTAVVTATKAQTATVAGSQARIDEWKPVLGETMGKELQRLATSGKLSTDKDIAIAWREIGVGLKAVK